MIALLSDVLGFNDRFLEARLKNLIVAREKLELLLQVRNLQREKKAMKSTVCRLGSCRS